MKQLSPCGRTGHGLVWLLVSAFPLTLAAAVHLIDPGAVPIPSIGRNSHLVLDASGHPVVVFSDQINNDLFLLRCNDPACSGGDDLARVLAADADGDLPRIVLDASNHPVVTYFRGIDTSMVLLRCNDPMCAGEDEVLTVLDAGGSGGSSDVVLDGAGNPVVAWFDNDADSLVLIDCNDPACVSETVNVVSPGEGVISNISMVLDGVGRPVIAFQGFGFDLRLTHCNDPACAGGDDAAHTVYTTPNQTPDVRLKLDVSGNPVIGFTDAAGSGTVMLVHCNDSACSGSNESVQNVVVGRSSSMALDGAGRPAFAFRDGLLLKSARCNDVNCAGGNELITTVTSGYNDFEISMALDASGYPVVASGTSFCCPQQGGIRINHCSDEFCNGTTDVVVTKQKIDVGRSSSIVRSAGGTLFVAYWGAGDLRLRACQSPACDQLGDPLTVVESTGDVGADTSMVLAADGLPVIAHWDVGNDALRLADCGNAACTTAATAAVTGTGEGGRSPSLALDTGGRPVISFSAAVTGALKLAHCAVPTCISFSNSIEAINPGPDASGTALALDAAGNPIVAFHKTSLGALAVAHCNDPNCSLAVSGGESVEIPDPGPGVGSAPAVHLDAAGRPLIAYYDQAQGDLKFAACGDVGCTPALASVITLDDGGGADVGSNPAIDLDDSGRPVIAYHDATAGALRLAGCATPSCDAGRTIVVVDDVGFTGLEPALVVAGATVYVSYYDKDLTGLKLAEVPLSVFAADIFQDGFESE